MRKMIFVILMATVGLSFVGCVDKGPSEHRLRELFLDYFKKNAPHKWTGSLLGGKIKSIEIIDLQRGKSIKKNNGGRLPDLYAMSAEDCWPVKLHVKGEADGYGLLGRKINTKKFEEKLTIVICKKFDGGYFLGLGDFF